MRSKGQYREAKKMKGVKKWSVVEGNKKGWSVNDNKQGNKKSIEGKRMLESEKLKEWGEGGIGRGERIKEYHKRFQVAKRVEGEMVKGRINCT